MVKAADLEDLLADAYFQAWREAARFDVERGSAVTWLLTLVRSRALDLLRRRRSSHEVEDEGDSHPEAASDAPGPDELLSGTQAGTRLHAALVQLSSNERWVLGLAYYSDLSHREICDQTGLPLGTVKSLILRAQGKLREQLAAH
jgi:RNA polymerase sigma-70 factor (ECF subfamily)